MTGTRWRDLMNRNHAIVRDLGGSGEANEAMIAAALAGGATGGEAGRGGRRRDDPGADPRPATRRSRPCARRGPRPSCFPSPAAGADGGDRAWVAASGYNALMDYPKLSHRSRRLRGTPALRGMVRETTLSVTRLD